MPIPRPAEFNQRAGLFVGVALGLDDRDFIANLLARMVISMRPEDLRVFLTNLDPPGRDFVFHNADEMLIGGPHLHSFSMSGRMVNLTKGQFFRKMECVYCLHCKRPFYHLDLDQAGAFCKPCAFDLAFTGENLPMLARKLRREQLDEFAEELGTPRKRKRRGVFG